MGIHPFRCVFSILSRCSLDSDTAVFSNKANLDAHRRRFTGSLMRGDESPGGMSHSRVPQMVMIRQTRLRRTSRRNAHLLSEILRPRTTRTPPPRKVNPPPLSARIRNLFGEFPYPSAVMRTLGNRDGEARKKATQTDYALSSTNRLFATSSAIS